MAKKKRGKNKQTLSENDFRTSTLMWWKLYSKALIAFNISIDSFGNSLKQLQQCGNIKKEGNSHINEGKKWEREKSLCLKCVNCIDES